MEDMSGAYYPYYQPPPPLAAVPPPGAPPSQQPPPHQAPPYHHHQPPFGSPYALPPPQLISSGQSSQAQQLFQRDAQTITPEALESVKAALASSEIEHKAETKKKAIPRKVAGQTWEDPTLAEWPERYFMNPKYRYSATCRTISKEIRTGMKEVIKRVLPDVHDQVKAINQMDYYNGGKRSFGDRTARNAILTTLPDDYRLFCGDLGNEVNDEVLSKAFSRFPSFNMARVVRDKRSGKTRGYGFVSFVNPSDLAAAMKEMNGKYVGNRPIKLRKSNWKDRTDFDALERQKNQPLRKPKLPKKGILHK